MKQIVLIQSQIRDKQRSLYYGDATVLALRTIDLYSHGFVKMSFANQVFILPLNFIFRRFCMSTIISLGFIRDQNIVLNKFE
jgi:hypothetical protein